MTNHSQVAMTCSGTKFVRFTIDDDLRSWYDDNYRELSTPCAGALVDFVNVWDVAISSQYNEIRQCFCFPEFVAVFASIGHCNFNSSESLLRHVLLIGVPGVVLHAAWNEVLADAVIQEKIRSCRVMEHRMTWSRGQGWLD